jgi:hypothetical protein
VSYCHIALSVWMCYLCNAAEILFSKKKKKKKTSALIRWFSPYVYAWARYNVKRVQCVFQFFDNIKHLSLYDDVAWRQLLTRATYPPGITLWHLQRTIFTQTELFVFCFFVEGEKLFSTTNSYQFLALLLVMYWSGEINSL